MWEAPLFHHGPRPLVDYSVGGVHRDFLVYAIGEGTSEAQRNLVLRALEL